MIINKKLFIFLILSLLLTTLYVLINITTGFKNLLFIVLLPTLTVLLSAYYLLKFKSGYSLFYMLYLYLTHMGIGLLDVFMDDPLQNSIFRTDWYYSNLRDFALFYSGLALLFFIVGVLISNIFKTNVTLNQQGANLSMKKRGSSLIYKLGVTFSVYFALYLLFGFISGNLPLWGTYQQYFNAIGNYPFYSTSIFLYSLGISFIISNMQKDRIRFSVVIILLPAILLLITGNRGEILYPLTASLGTLIVRGVKLNKRLVLVILLSFFIVIPLVKEARNLDNYESLSSINFGFEAPITEIGFTLRTLIYTQEWKIYDNEEYGYGISYLIPLQRGVSNFLIGIDKMAYEGKSYNFRERLPTMGYSVISESFFNFGNFGVIVLLIIGISLGYIADNSRNFYFLSFSSGLTAILINNIRNAFSFVPGQIVMLLAIILVCYLIEKRRKMV